MLRAEGSAPIPAQSSVRPSKSCMMNVLYENHRIGADFQPAKLGSCGYPGPVWTFGPVLDRAGIGTEASPRVNSADGSNPEICIFPTHTASELRAGDCLPLNPHGPKVPCRYQPSPAWGRRSQLVWVYRSPHRCCGPKVPRRYQPSPA